MRPAPKKRRPSPRPAATVSGQLREIIRARGLTPYAVATAAGVSPSIVTRFDKGDRGLTTPTLDAICSALGLELRETRRGRPAPGGRQGEAGSPADVGHRREAEDAAGPSPLP